MTADDLTKILAARIPVPLNDIRPLAEAVIEMCNEARAEEREACAKVADGYREKASLTVFTLETGSERDEWINKGDAAVEIAAGIRSRSSEGGNG